MHVGAQMCERALFFFPRVHLTVSKHSCFFLHLHLGASAVNEMHLDIYNFIMPCNNISLCDGKQAEREREGTGGGRLLFVWAVFHIMLEWKSATWHNAGADCSRSPVLHRWVVMDTRPPLVKPRCPCFIRHPTGSAALLISGFRQLAPRPSSTSHWPLLCCWRNPVHSRSSALLTDGYMGGLSKRQQGLCKPVHHLWGSWYLDQMHVRV